MKLLVIRLIYKNLDLTETEYNNIMGIHTTGNLFGKVYGL
jgi:hypothetical protein